MALQEDASVIYAGADTSSADNVRSDTSSDDVNYHSRGHPQGQNDPGTDGMVDSHGADPNAWPPGYND